MSRGFLQSFYELLSSMRFAISLLTVLAIASVVGTVLQQNQPFNAYLNQFGPFWFPLFERLGLYGVYNAGWFLLILAFLVLSTSACLLRQTTPMLREMRRYGEQAREQSLLRFSHVAEVDRSIEVAEARRELAAYVAAFGFRQRENLREDGVLIAAKQGSFTRWGYFLTHGAIVLICIGGLIDGNLPLRLQMALGGKEAVAPNRLISEIPDSARLGMENPSFRANLFIPEGRSASMAVLPVGDGILLQELPFSVSLKKFHIDHFENGMPKRFASDVIITDVERGTSFEHTIEVNHPLTYRGLTLYQASFDDGGSTLSLLGRNLLAHDEPLELKGEVGDALRLHHPQFQYTLELTNFTVFNVEDFSPAQQPSAAVGLGRLREQLGSGVSGSSGRDLRNIGPSFQFKLRDEAGQALEFQNYMLPIEQEGRWFLFSGVRSNPNDSFSYLRIPLDEAGQVDPWYAMNALWMDPRGRSELAGRYAASHSGADGLDPAAGQRLTETALRTLELFADGGFEAIGRFLEATVPANEQERAADVFVRILQGLAWESWSLVRERAGAEPLEINEARALYLRDSLAALSDARFYPAPLVFQLSAYDHLQATVLQVTRSPGQPVVYLGSFLLVLGIFFMLYIRERRLFVLVRNQGSTLIAMSSNRRTLDVDEAFEAHRRRIEALLGKHSLATIPPHSADPLP